MKYASHFREKVLPEEHFLVKRAIFCECGKWLLASHHASGCIDRRNSAAIARLDHMKRVMVDLKSMPAIFGEGWCLRNNQVWAKTFQGHRRCQTLIKIIKRTLTKQMILKACESGEIMVDLIPRLNRMSRLLWHKDQLTWRMQKILKPCIRLFACWKRLA